MRQRSSRFGQKIRGEFARELPVFCLSPRPFLLRQLWMLPEERILLKYLAVRKLVCNDDVKPFIFHPLPEFAIGKLFSIDIA